MSTLYPRLIAHQHAHLVSLHYCLLSKCQPSCPPCVPVFVPVIMSTLCRPSLCLQSCQPLVPVLVLAIMFTVCPCLGECHQFTLCPRRCACHHVKNVFPHYCLLSQCPPSCQPFVPAFGPAIMSILCPRLGARHQVNLVSSS